MTYKVGQKFGFTSSSLITFSFQLIKKEGENMFLTIDSDGIDGRISTGELDRALSQNKIYLKNGTITTNNT